MDLMGFWWLAWLGVFFLPVELWAAIKTPTRADTFSELVWFWFGVPRTKGPYAYRWVPFARLRRTILAAFMGSLSTHLVLGWSVIPVALFGGGVVIVIVRAVGWERGPKFIGRLVEVRIDYSEQWPLGLMPLDVRTGFAVPIMLSDYEQELRALEVGGECFVQAPIPPPTDREPTEFEWLRLRRVA